MEPCILKGDKTLQQHWSLSFVSNTENKLQQETMRHQRVSLLLTLVLAGTVGGTLFASQGLEFSSFLVCAGGLGSLWIPVARRLLGAQVVILAFSISFGPNAGFFEYLGVRLIPFTCHYLIVKRWNVYLANSLIEGL